MPETDPLLGHRNGNASSSTSSLSSWSKLKHRLVESIDVNKCGPPLAVQCFIAGAADAAAYGQTNTWAAFMTGNITQLSISAMTLILTHPNPEASITRLFYSSSAVLGFIIGSFVASLIDKRLHSKHRGKFVFSALVRSVIFLGVAACIASFGWAGHNGYMGMAMLFVLAANMGNMAVNSSKLGPTPFATTVVFTATLASFFSDPLLPFSLSSASKTRGLTIICLIAGGMISQAIGILTTRATNSGILIVMDEVKALGSAYAIAMVAVADFVSAILWLRTSKAEE